jgi:hypothetical protein
VIEVIGRYIEAHGDGRRWKVCNRSHGDVLGEINWYESWRAYIFTPQHYTQFSADCLRDIAAFLERKNGEAQP